MSIITTKQKRPANQVKIQENKTHQTESYVARRWHLRLLPSLATQQQDQTQHTRSGQQQPSQHLLNTESSKPAIHAPSRRQQQNQAPPNCHQPNTQPNRRHRQQPAAPNSIKPKKITKHQSSALTLSQPSHSNTGGGTLLALDPSQTTTRQPTAPGGSNL